MTASGFLVHLHWALPCSQVRPEEGHHAWHGGWDRQNGMGWTRGLVGWRGVGKDWGKSRQNRCVIRQENEPKHATHRTVFKDMSFSFVNHCPHNLMTFSEQKGSKRAS